MQMDGQSEYIEYRDKREQLDKAVQEHLKVGDMVARTNKAYKVAFAKKQAELRDKGFPITIINKQAEGDEEVAQLCFEYEIARYKQRGLELMIDALRTEISAQKDELKHTSY